MTQTNTSSSLTKTFVDTVTYRPGAVILYPGKSDMLYRVASGLVRVHTMDDDGNGLTLRYVKPGEYFGEEALAGVNRAYFAEAVTDSTVDVINPALMSAEDNLIVTTHLVKTLERASYHVLDRDRRLAMVDTLVEGDDGSVAQLTRYQFSNHLGGASLELDHAAAIIS